MSDHLRKTLWLAAALFLLGLQFLMPPIVALADQSVEQPLYQRQSATPPLRPAPTNTLPSRSSSTPVPAQPQPTATQTFVPPTTTPTDSSTETPTATSTSTPSATASATLANSGIVVSPTPTASTPLASQSSSGSPQMLALVGLGALGVIGLGWVSVLWLRSSRRGVLPAAGPLNPSSGNIHEMLFLSIREAVQSIQEDIKYWLENMKRHQKMSEKLEEYLESQDEAGSGDDDP